MVKSQESEGAKREPRGRPKRVKKKPRGRQEGAKREATGSY